MAHHADRAGDLTAKLAIQDARESIERTLATARELLELDIEYVSGEDRTEGPPRPGVLTVPVRPSSGRARMYGTLHCSSTRRFRPLTEGDGRSVRVLARVLADQLEREEEEMERRLISPEATGLRALLAAVEARDAYTGDHCRNVVDLSTKVARRLGLSARETLEVEQVALLHDVGKVAVADEVLQKPGALTEDELRVIEAHPDLGARIVRSIPGLSHLAPAIRAGHERWDGTGYPDGLRGEQIPLVSRITFVCDAYDAMTSDRPYRRALDRHRAVEELERAADKQFCRRSVEALVATLEDEGELGAKARLGA